MKTTDFDKLKKMVKAAGYDIRLTAKHHAVYTLDGQKLMGFAVNHAKGQKRMVLNIYVKRIMQRIQQHQEATRYE